MALECVAWAASVAEHYVGPLGRRWRHVCAVARLARVVGEALDDGSDVLVAAGYLHDIGYAPELAASGFHPLDGARFLRSIGRPELAGLVAHHSGARNEAVLRGITVLCEEFPFESTAVAEALTYCDLTTGPAGARVTLEQRIADIRQRYGPESVVARAIEVGRPEFERSRDNTERRMAEAGVAIGESLAYCT